MSTGIHLHALLRRPLIPLLAGAILAGAATSACRTASQCSLAWWHDRPAAPAPAPDVADDASRMNATRVARTWRAPADTGAAEAELRTVLAQARAAGLPVTIAGARHTQGGHTLADDAVVLDMRPLRHMALDRGTGLLTVGAGATWADIIPFLDAAGRSVAVMQSNHDFTVGGSLGANCHGWQVRSPPIASTVEALRVVRADGAAVRCSRTENPGLFSLVLGGYGLFGVVLEAELRTVPNARYRVHSERLPADDYPARYQAVLAAQPDIGMAYGRLCVVPGDDFLREALLTTFKEEAGDVPALEPAPHPKLRRAIYRAQLEGRDGMEVRWKNEAWAAGRMDGRGVFSRNQLLNEPAAVYQERNADRTDILHEYFVPPERFGDFLALARARIPCHRCTLMNVTVREVRTDPDAFLRYADRPVFALVMLFNQERSAAGEADMADLTRGLVDAALACDGRHYLPYRLHATPEQFHAAYPQASEFFRLKRIHDPDHLFRNRFWEAYGTDAAAAPR